MKEASKKKEEIQSYSQKLTSKEEQIRRLAEKIAEQETKMAKLQEELDSHHPTSEQLSAEQMRQDDERDQQLLTLRTLTIQLKLEQKTIENEKKNENVNLERMKWYLAKHESNIVSSEENPSVIAYNSCSLMKSTKLYTCIIAKPYIKSTTSIYLSLCILTSQGTYLYPRIHRA